MGTQAIPWVSCWQALMHEPPTEQPVRCMRPHYFSLSSMAHAGVTPKMTMKWLT